jgi:hypothetical protein
MTNLIESLQQTLGLSTTQICEALCCHYTAQKLDPELIEQWLSRTEALPKEVNQAAALVVIEQWMAKRDSCGPTELLAVDKQFTRLLRDFSMAEIIALRRQLLAEQL